MADALEWLQQWQEPEEVARECKRYLEARTKKVTFSFSALEWQVIERAGRAAAMLMACYDDVWVEMRMRPRGDFFWRQDQGAEQRAFVQPVTAQDTHLPMMEALDYDLFLDARGAKEPPKFASGDLPPGVRQAWMVTDNDVGRLQ